MLPFSKEILFKGSARPSFYKSTIILSFLIKDNGITHPGPLDHWPMFSILVAGITLKFDTVAESGNVHWFRLGRD